MCKALHSIPRTTKQNKTKQKSYKNKALIKDTLQLNKPSDSWLFFDPRSPVFLLIRWSIWQPRFSAQVPRTGFCCLQSVTVTDSPASLLDCYWGRCCAHRCAVNSKVHQKRGYHPLCTPASIPPTIQPPPTAEKTTPNHISQREWKGQKSCNEAQNRTLMLHLIITSLTMIFVIT
jgi:hypothetical protein